MDVGDLVKIVCNNGPDTQQNIGKIGIVIFILPNLKEVEVRLFSNDSDPLLERWLYYIHQLEKVNE
tara:strand:+ start:55 stop:252 length:198 start_codon:yes stop_codon:yes gene_type:complete